MKKIKTYISCSLAMLFILVAVCSFGMTSNALTVSIVHAENELSPNDPEPLGEEYTCTNCYNLCYTRCMNSRLPSTSDDGYHTKKCYVTHYKSYAKLVCNCGWNDWLRVDGSPAKHYCKEVHSYCSKGNYDVCYIGVYF